MSKRKAKPIKPISAKEAVVLCRIAKGLGFLTKSIPSSTSASFVGVRVSGRTNPMGERKFIAKSFQKVFGYDKRLDFTEENNPFSNDIHEVMVSVV